MGFEVKNNYDECLTNLACSVRRYFGLEYKHRSLSYIDELLDKFQPKNVVTILLDGMGSNILDRVLDKKSFFIKNRVRAISSVFPATTVAATTAMTTGLNPVESGMLGWDMYYKGLDRTITTFLSIEKGTSEVLAEAVAYKDAHMKTESIVDQINRAGLYQGFSLFPFGPKPYKDFDDMLAIIRARCAQDGRKYIYAYDTEPDSSMHKFGCYCEQAKKLIFERNDKIEKLCCDLKDSIVFVVADHGHRDISNINLADYPDVTECLVRNTSIEPRAVNFFIKDDKKKVFEALFDRYFGADFDLLPKADVIALKLFGDGEENEIFRDALGDYLAIAKGDKAIIYGGGMFLKSHHAGYTDDEIYVPLIVWNGCK